MQSRFKIIFKVLFMIIMGTIAATYLVSCFTQYFYPSNGLFLTLLSLSFPVVLGFMVFASLVCYFINKKAFIGCLIILCFGYENISNTFSFHFNNKLPTHKTNTIKVLSWNVNAFINEQHPPKERAIMYQFIKDTDADILCIQDNTFYIGMKKYTDDIKDLEKLGYIYHVISADYSLSKDLQKKSGKYGTGIFSKYPISYSNKVSYTGHFYESILFADINIHNKKLRVYNTHLRSMIITEYLNFSPLQDYTFLQDDTADLFRSSRLHKLNYFYRKHAEQATIAKQVMDTTKLPFIFCADLNSVPSSYVYHHLAKGLKDAFLEKGFGLGHTYYGLSHTLRIDVTLTSPDIKTLDYASPHLDLSDHYPVITTLALP